jgi:hypothetical protein
MASQGKRNGLRWQSSASSYCIRKALQKKLMAAMAANKISPYLSVISNIKSR